MTDDKPLDLIGSAVFAALFLWLTYDHGGADTWLGILFLAGWCYHLTRAGLAAEVLTRRWITRRRFQKKESTLGRYWTDEEREGRAASAARHPSRRRPVPASVEDHYSGPRKIVKSDDGEAIVAYPPGATAYLVHNHGPHEGRGLECPEYGGTSGRLRGACVIEADRRRYAEAVEYLARRDAHVRDVHQAHHEGRLETVEPEDLP